MHKLGFLALLILYATGAHAQTTALKTGKAVKVTPSATAEQNAQVRTLRVNDDVRQREVIRTSAGGEAQLIFEDGTRIAVGPGSTLILEEYVFGSRGRAEKVSINALAGTFRFISGRSRKGTYGIRTPAATIGIRGTAFDFAVSPSFGTELVMFRGSVDMCLTANPIDCVRVQGPCRAAAAAPQNSPRLLDSSDEREVMLRDRFQYTQNQNSLLVGFRLNIDSCEDPATLRELRRAAIEDDDRDGKRDNDTADIEINQPEVDFDPPDFGNDNDDNDDDNNNEVDDIE